MNLVSDLRSAHHQMSLSPYLYIQTVALHPGLHLTSSSTLIGSAPVTNQARYKSPAFSPGHFISSVSPPAFCTLARFTDYSLVSPPNGLHSPRISMSCLACIWIRSPLALLPTLQNTPSNKDPAASNPDIVQWMEEQRNITVTPAVQPTRQMAAASEHALIMAATTDPVHKMAAAPERAHAMAATAMPIHKMAAAPVRAHVMAVTVEPVHKMAAKTELRHVTAATPEPSKAKAVFPKSSQVAAAFPESSHVAAAFPESSQVTAVFPESSKVTAVFVSSQVKLQLCFLSQVKLQLCFLSQAESKPSFLSQAKSQPSFLSQAESKLSFLSQAKSQPSFLSQAESKLSFLSQAKSQPSFLSQAKSQPSFLSQAKSKLSAQSQVTSRLTTQSLAMSRSIMMASVLDPPLVSVWAANISVASAPYKPTINEVLPPVAALPLMAVAIWCVWAAHCAPEVPSDHRSAPDIPSDHKSAPEVPSDHKSAPKVSSDHKSASEVPSDHKSALEVLSVHESAPEASPVPVHDVGAWSALEGSSAFSCASCSALQGSCTSWRVSAPSALPWRAPAPPALPPAPPWRAPAPPAPPWWAPALPVLPQSPGPPHGPGPPTFALFRPRPTAPLDCWWVGASGSRSLVGGYVMNLVGDLRPAHHQMSLSPYLYIQTVALHPGLHLPSSSALIGSAPVTNQARYKSPGLSPCYSQIIVVICIVVSLVP
ncbi:Adhesive plaque matrix protein [Labeo rohita]|uniref:Adhesive plaque matrix protein n=1 Tax=Labeo rohita TaxID=84645 RepID=A0ABQ8LU93_LABRO|nr:Adhesive plaque matrix protein [Labeo rohita]